MNDETRMAAYAALLAGWSITLRDNASGDVSTREGATGYLHATMRMGEDGSMRLLTSDEGWLDVAALPQMSRPRRMRARLALAFCAWLGDGEALDGERFTLTGEGACEVCGRTLTRSVARGFTTGDACGGRLKATLAERRGWSLPLSALMSRAGKATPPAPPACGGALVCTDWDCPLC